MTSDHIDTDRSKIRRGILAGAFVAVAVAVIAIAVPMALHQPAGATAGATRTPVAGPPAVPWVATPVTASASTRPAPPTAAACTAADLDTEARVQDDRLGISETDAANVTLRNIGTLPCTLSGRPALYSPGGARLATTSATALGGMVVSPATIGPGESATVQLAKTLACNGGTGTTITAKDIRLSVAGTRVPIPGLTLSGTCPGISVSPWFTVVDEPANAYAGLQGRIDDPGPITPGHTLHYVVELTNTSSDPISLAGCPGYRESVAKHTETYALNCSAGTIAAGATVRFGMQIEVPADLPAGLAQITWDFIGPNVLDAMATFNP